ncbi:histidine phosphatase family protein [Kovacikia minuta]|uniref:histidine phosphatase family protein n=1 Tax=Kovacikia minuta TaxID=2931930 RepID=UPI0020C7A786|nr:histidine phosphatase family protein [Kovacikia minuta]
MQQFMKILFIRHAESTGNREKRMQGHGDFALTAMGRQQAKKLADRLLTEAWIPSHIYSSPLQRAAQTTQILVEHCRAGVPVPTSIAPVNDSPGTPELSSEGFAVEYADELKEFQNGIFQGLTWVEAMARYPQQCHELETSLDWIQIPEAESLWDARTRAFRLYPTPAQSPSEWRSNLGHYP